MIQGHPFIVDYWDILVIVLSAVVRLAFALKSKASEKKSEFRLKKYFDLRHFIRWGCHLLTALVMALFIPEFVLDYLAPKYFPEVTYWSFIGDFLIGFAGYDAIRLAEKKAPHLIDKLIGKKIN